MTDSDDRTTPSETATTLDAPPVDPKLRVVSKGVRRRRKRAQIPVTIRLILPLVALVLLGRFLYEQWQAGRVVVEFVAMDGSPLEIEGEIELFSDTSHPADPAPQFRLTEAMPVSGSSYVFDVDQIGEGANVRVRTADHGTAFVAVEPDGEPTLLHLAPAVGRRGLVTDRAGAPIAGALVTAIGWAERGVPLAETTTDADGRFELAGVSGAQLVWNVRVLADGFVVENVDWSINEDDASAERTIVLVESVPVSGRIVLPDGLEPSGLSVGVLRLPSVDAPVDEDGGFVLDHVPTRHTQVRLIVRGLPSGFTHRQTVVPLPADALSIEVLPARRVVGRVISGHNDKPLPNARVSHLHGPRGDEYVACDGDGRFELDFVPPIDLEIHAVYVRSEGGDKTTVSSEAIPVEAGSDALELVIPIY